MDYYWLFRTKRLIFLCLINKKSEPIKGVIPMEQKQSSVFQIYYIVLLIRVFMTALDNGIISAALSTINSYFNFSATARTWGITLYTLGLKITTPIVGKLSDRYGRKKLFLIEIVIFTIGSL